MFVVDIDTTLYGPFNSKEEATAWAEPHADDGRVAWFLLPVINPDSRR